MLITSNIILKFFNDLGIKTIACADMSEIFEVSIKTKNSFSIFYLNGELGF